MCLSKHVEPSKNFGIINSITKLHLVGISTELSTMHGSMNVKFLKCFLRKLDSAAASLWVSEQVYIVVCLAMLENARDTVSASNIRK